MDGGQRRRVRGEEVRGRVKSGVVSTRTAGGGIVGVMSWGLWWESWGAWSGERW